MNSNFVSNQSHRRRVFTRTQQTPFILANKQYQLSNNIYARQYTTTSKTSNGSTNSVSQLKTQSRSRIRSVSAKSLFSPAKAKRNFDSTKPLLKNKFVPLPKNQLIKNQDHGSVQKKLKQILNQKLNKKILKIKQQTHRTEGVRKIVDESLLKHNTKTQQDISLNIKLRKQNLQHSFNNEKFNTLISRHLEYQNLDYLKQQKIKNVNKVDASTSMDKIANDQKNQIQRKSIGIEVNIPIPEIPQNSIQQQIKNSKVKGQKSQFKKNNLEKQQKSIKLTNNYKEKQQQQKVIFDRKSQPSQEQINIQMSNDSMKQVKRQKTTSQKRQSPKDQKIILAEISQKKIEKHKLQKQTVKTQVKNVKANYAEKQEFDLDQIQDITLTVQSKQNLRPIQKQQSSTPTPIKKQPKKQKVIKQVKQQKIIRQMIQEKPQQNKVQVKQSSNIKQLPKPPTLKKQSVQQKKPSHHKKEDSQDKKQKLKQMVQKQLQQANKIIDIMTPVGEVAGYCSQSLKKSKVNWFTPAILLYKQCYDKFKQYQFVYNKAAEIEIIEPSQKDKYVEENGTILKNLQKVIAMAKKKNKLSPEYQKLVTSTQPVHLSTIIQKQVLAFAKEVSQSEQQQNSDVLMCLLRMVNSVKILAFLKGLKVQPIANLQQIEQNQLPGLLRSNLDSIQLKKLKI